MLLLFDIDGTLLLKATEAHADALHFALREVFGLSDPTAEQVAKAGRTDGEIAREILGRGGISGARVDEQAAALLESACEAYERSCPPDLSERVSPGVPELLAWLDARDDVRLALLTGNFERIARLKLARASIGGYFPPGQGAFGSDDESRPALPAVARARAGADGEPYPRERTIVIGDTPLDIACARADGVRCVAVATGPYALSELGGADAVASDAWELRAVLEGLLARCDGP